MSDSFGCWEERTIRDFRGMAEREALLAARGLSVPVGSDTVLGLYEGEDLIATGSLVGNVIQGLAVDRRVEGQGAAAVLATALIKAAVGKGLKRLAVFTKPSEAGVFEDLGFRLLASVARPSSGLGVSLLEWGKPGIEEWKASVARKVAERPKDAGAAVVNCNPFTLGHLGLLRYAAARVPWLHVLVVEEDRSLFPFDVRIELVRRGTLGIPNVEVHPGGPYVISSATFPTYFIRPRPGSEDAAAAELYAALDLEMFRTHVAPALGVTERFVGTEPYCPTTATYNALMKEILPAARAGSGRVLVHEMPRIEQDGEAVSASRVREGIRSGSLESVRELVPETTWEWLVSAAAAPVIERIRGSDTRH